MTDISFLFADYYDEKKKLANNTKRGPAWTASGHHSSMYSATSRLEAYFINSKQTVLQKPQSPDIAKTKVVQKIILPPEPAREGTAKTKVIRKAPAARKKTAKPEPNPTRVIRKVVTKPLDAPAADAVSRRTSGRKKQAASSRAATTRIAATRVAATSAAEPKLDLKHSAYRALLKKKMGLVRLLTKPRKQTQKKIFWPYMIMIVSIVFIASLVTFLYLIRSSQNRFFMAIRDKEAPVLEVIDLDIYNDQTVTVNDFVTVCEDSSRVKVYLRSPIDFTIDGEQTVTIVAEDAVGNKTAKSVTLNHIIDQSPPRITGDPVIRTVRGESVAYKAHISVLDDYDTDPVIEIDNSGVNLDAEGTYTVQFAATDKCGNRANFQSQVVVSAPSSETVSDEEVSALVDQILSEITTDDMQPIDKVWAIYEYIRHIPYNGREHSYNYKYEGYKLLRDQKGECYGSYSAAKLFFDRLGYENLSMEKNVGSTHFWNMVSLDGGKTFYHFDATNWHEWGPKKPVMCMISDSVLEKISEEHRGTHRYDHSLFPATPAESMPVPDYVPSKYGEDY